MDKHSGGMTKERAQGIGCLAVLVIAAVVWIGSMFGGQEPEFIPMAQPDHFAMIIPAEAAPEQVEKAVREKCAARQFCKVLGWSDKANAARTLPMLDREYEALILDYYVNRVSSAEKFSWSCRNPTAGQLDRCLSE